MTQGLIKGKDGRTRCWWCGEDELYRHYHDTEWGRPVHDDRRLFEKICLEGFQAGLSWLTILRKRENFRAAFCDFDFRKVAEFREDNIESLLHDNGIIRHRGKIEATINNAQRALELVNEFGSLDAYFWSCPPAPDFSTPAKTSPTKSSSPRRRESRTTETPITDHRPPMTKSDIPARTPVSAALSKDLKKRGWKFVGPTTCYAFMQAMGMVNDHLHGCDFRQ